MAPLTQDTSSLFEHIEYLQVGLHSCELPALGMIGYLGLHRCERPALGMIGYLHHRCELQALGIIEFPTIFDSEHRS